MKKLFTLFALSFGLSVAAQTNVGINTTTPDASAALDITSTTQGMLVPRMTTAQRNAIASPANGLMVYDVTLNSFYFYNGTAWTALGATGAAGANGGTTVDLVVTKTAATQTPSNANGTNTGDVITFDNVTTTPALGSYSTSTNTYTVGAGQGGLYYVQVRSVSVDNATPNNTTGHWFKIEITPNGGSPSFVNNRDVYGPYPVVAASNFPSGLRGRSEISAMVQLNAGDSFVIKGLSANSSIQNTIKSDGSCKLTVVKMN